MGEVPRARRLLGVVAEVSQAAKRFARALQDAGLDVRVSPRGDDYKVLSASGQLLGAFGAGIDKGRTRKNICAQIKRATGIEVR